MQAATSHSQKPAPVAFNSWEAEVRDSRSKYKELSLRQAEIVVRKASGMTDRETAEDLNCTISNIKSITESLRVRYGAKNTMELVGILIGNRLLHRLPLNSMTFVGFGLMKALAEAHQGGFTGPLFSLTDNDQ